MNLFWAPLPRRPRWWHRYTDRWVARWKTWRFRHSGWVLAGTTTSEGRPPSHEQARKTIENWPGWRYEELPQRSPGDES